MISIEASLRRLQTDRIELYYIHSFDPAVALVECDAVLIERVLANLLENAGKYTPAR